MIKDLQRRKGKQSSNIIYQLLLSTISLVDFSLFSTNRLPITEVSPANIQKHIHESLPEEYEKTMLGTKRNLRHALEIREPILDPKIKLEAIRIANECYKFIMELSTNGMVISDAIKYVNKQKEQPENIKTLKMLDERIEASEAEKSTDGVF